MDRERAIAFLSRAPFVHIASAKSVWSSTTRMRRAGFTAPSTFALFTSFCPFDDE